MKNTLTKNSHWIIILYAFWGLFTIYEEKEEILLSSISQIEPMKIQIQRMKIKMKKIERFKKNLSSSKERIVEVVKQIERVQKQLPSNVNDTEIESLVGKIANDLKIRRVETYPDKESDNGFYFSKEYKFTGYGTFVQFLIFFENLEKTERIINVKNFTLTFDSNKTKGRFPIVNIDSVIESFRYNTKYTEKSGVDEIEKRYEI